MFTYTILGLEIFSNTLRFSYNNEPRTPFDGPHEDTSDVFDVPPTNFNTFIQSTLSVFIVLANDGWTNIYYDHYRTSGPAITNFFFISLVILGQLILFNLFLAILLKEFDERAMI